jgi:hypothetical protein
MRLAIIDPARSRIRTPDVKNRSGSTMGPRRVRPLTGPRADWVSACRWSRPWYNRTARRRRRGWTRVLRSGGGRWVRRSDDQGKRQRVLAATEVSRLAKNQASGVAAVCHLRLPCALRRRGLLAGSYGAAGSAAACRPVDQRLGSGRRHGASAAFVRSTAGKPLRVFKRSRRRSTPAGNAAPGRSRRPVRAQSSSSPSWDSSLSTVPVATT